MEASTQSGDVSLSTEDTANILMERRNARAEESVETTVEAEESVETEELEEVGQEATTEEGQEDIDEQIDAESDEQANFESVDELAAAVGMDVQDFLEAIKITTAVDGETEAVPLAKLLKGYQLESSFTRKNQQWLDQQKADQEAIDAQRKQTAESFHAAGLTFRMAQNQLTSEFQSINWDELQKSDPQTYVLKRQQFGEKQAQLNQAIEQSRLQAEQAVQAQNQQQAEANQAKLQKEFELMTKAVPAWKDETTFDTDRGKIAKYLSDRGFTDADEGFMSDHRFILLARDAMSRPDISSKKVVNVAKLVKPGSSRPKGGTLSKEAQKATNHAKKTGKVDDVAEALIARRAAARSRKKR